MAASSRKHTIVILSNVYWVFKKIIFESNATRVQGGWPAGKFSTCIHACGTQSGNVEIRMCINNTASLYRFIKLYYYIMCIYIRSDRLIACRACVQNGEKDGGKNRELTRDRSVVSSRAASHCTGPIYM